MKTSFCTLAFQKKRWGQDPLVIERPVREVVPILAKAGYDGAELWGPHIECLSTPELDELRHQLRDLGLRVPMVSPYFDFTTSDESARLSVRQGMAMLDRARRLGALGIRCFTGKVGSAGATDEQWERAARSLRELADAAAAEGIVCALETHSNNLMDTIDSALRLLGMADRPNVRLIFQPSMFKPEEYLRAAEALAPRVFHVHGADYGGTAIDYGKVLRILEAAGFDGFVSVENFGPDPDSAVVSELQSLRRLF